MHFFCFAAKEHPKLETRFEGCFAAKEHPKLETRFEGRIQEAIKYASSIDDFDELVDPQTLARHCLGLKPSYYVFRALHREEKK